MFVIALSESLVSFYRRQLCIFSAVNGQTLAAADSFISARSSLLNIVTNASKNIDVCAVI